MNLSTDSWVAATSNQASCELEGEAVILSLEDCVYYGLNEVGFAVWALIQTPACVVDIRDQVARRFEVELDVCEKDILNLLEQLRDAGLVQEVPAPEKTASG
ncbi:PqqD family protein [Methylocystis sp. H62]|uniref:PqqD family protein n=1 Tax=Methylocystis sp. H62 TaxID=2785789 RepID=UPI0018C27BD6|nr:PqqD family protein [Methylocystis sp. H62]